MTEVDRAAPARLVAFVCATAVLAGATALHGWFVSPPTQDIWLRLGILSALGMLSWNLKEPDVGSRISFSFLSIVLLASAVIVGPFGSAVVGFLSVLVDRSKQSWYQRLFNMSMGSVIGAFGALAYYYLQGPADPTSLRGFGELSGQVGFPLLVVDIVQCLTNAMLLAGVIHFHQRVPFGVMVRRVLAGSGIAYIGYGIIGFLFVILWFPAELGPFSALLVLAPLLAARWAFIQYGDEVRSHERTLDTLVTALGKKEPGAVLRSRRSARLAEWVAEELSLGPHQIGTVRYAATLHEIGHVGVPTRMLRRQPESLTVPEQRLVLEHGVVGARMIEGIDFLDDARSGIRHQHEHFDGAGAPDGLVGGEIPLAARIVAAASVFDRLTAADGAALPVQQALRALDAEIGRFDPAVLDAVRAVLDKHPWPPLGPVGPA